MGRPATFTLIALLASCGGATSTELSSADDVPTTASSTTTTIGAATTTEPPAQPTVTSVTTSVASSATTTPAATSSSNTGAVRYSIRTVGSLAGAVDVVERSTADHFVYVVSRLGTIERWRHNGTRIDQVLDMTTSTTGEGERGLLGLAFRRGVTGTWAAYLNMTDKNGDTTIVRHDVDASGKFSPAGTIILAIGQPYANHNGGDLRIGPDNMLYVATGDGGAAGDPERRALDLSSLLGKVLRIDPNRSGYTVPADNPWVGTAGARPEIWSIGLRNPWRFTFDDVGNLWVADVGQGEIEEASVARASGTTLGGRKVNFGWSAYEGTRRYNSDQQAPGSLEPFVEYNHEGGRCSISGAAVGTDGAVPGRRGWFFYGDYCSGDLWASLSLEGGPTRTDKIADNIEEITAVRVTSAGMWVTTLSGDVLEVTTSQ